MESFSWETQRKFYFLFFTFKLFRKDYNLKFDSIEKNEHQIVFLLFTHI